MTYTRDDLLKLVHQTKALSIWNHKTGPVFWYILGVPGPFYVNTEQLLGKATADALLQKITTILEATNNPQSRAEQVEKAVMAVYQRDKVYKDIIATMLERSNAVFPFGSYSFVSGGERRDWLFSIPFAKELAIKHLYLFKNQSSYCQQPITAREKGLHVSDLINNGASYFTAWLPAFEKAQLSCVGTVCVISRNAAALEKLEKAGVKPVALNSIDVSFFEQSHANGLITKDMLDEITMHFHSPEEWASKYLMGNAALFDAKNVDKKSFERLQSFFTIDPWGMRENHNEFFAEMQNEIASRLHKAA